MFNRERIDLQLRYLTEEGKGDRERGVTSCSLTLLALGLAFWILHIKENLAAVWVRLPRSPSKTHVALSQRLCLL